MLTAKQSNTVINGKLKSIAKSSANIADVTRDTAWLIMGHAMAHGDVSHAGRLIDVYPTEKGKTSLRLFFRESGISLSVKDGKTHASITNKHNGLILFPSDKFDPLNFSTEKTREKKDSQATTREKNAKERELQKEKELKELEALREDSRKLADLLKKQSDPKEKAKTRELGKLAAKKELDSLKADSSQLVEAKNKILLLEAEIISLRKERDNLKAELESLKLAA